MLLASGVPAWGVASTNSAISSANTTWPTLRPPNRVDLPTRSLDVDYRRWQVGQKKVERAAWVMRLMGVAQTVHGSASRP